MTGPAAHLPGLDDAAKGSRPLRVGVSACLLGERVRWNGAHRHAANLAAAFEADVEWVRFCPEIEIGLGVPREPIELVAAPGRPRLVGVASGRDLTEKMSTHARRRATALAADGLDGCVLKSGSPSCGLLVPVRGASPASPAASPSPFPFAAPGLFAAQLVPALFDVPVVEETRTVSRDALLHFAERMLAGRRLRRFLAGEWSPAALAGFVERHELQLVGHSAAARGGLEALVAGVAARLRDGAPFLREARRVRHAFARALLVPPTRERRAGALRRAHQRVAATMDAARNASIEASILAFVRGESPFSISRTLLRDAAEAAGDALLLSQTLLDPEEPERRLQEFL